MANTQQPKVARTSTSISVSTELWREFKSVTALRGRTVSEVVDALISGWIAKNRKRETAA